MLVLRQGADISETSFSYTDINNKKSLYRVKQGHQRQNEQSISRLRDKNSLPRFMPLEDKFILRDACKREKRFIVIERY